MSSPHSAGQLTLVQRVAQHRGGIVPASWPSMRAIAESGEGRRVGTTLPEPAGPTKTERPAKPRTAMRLPFFGSGSSPPSLRQLRSAKEEASRRVVEAHFLSSTWAAVATFRAVANEAFDDTKS